MLRTVTTLLTTLVVAWHAAFGCCLHHEHEGACASDAPHQQELLEVDDGGHDHEHENHAPCDEDRCSYVGSPSPQPTGDSEHGVPTAVSQLDAVPSLQLDVRTVRSIADPPLPLRIAAARFVTQVWLL